MIVRPSGRAWRLGDHVDTDVLFPGRYMTLATGDTEGLRHVLEVESENGMRLEPGDVILAGANFGCGSSREYAPKALKDLGVSCIIARSYARIFYRNCANIGLPAIECEAIDEFPSAAPRQIDLRSGVVSFDGELSFRAEPVPPYLLTLLEAGGLIPFLTASASGSGRGAAAGSATPVTPTSPEKDVTAP